MINHGQTRILLNPPNGVIGPNQMSRNTANIYKLQEKCTISVRKNLLDAGYWILDAGFSLLVSRFSMPDIGCMILEN